MISYKMLACVFKEELKVYHRNSEYIVLFYDNHNNWNKYILQP